MSQLQKAARRARQDKLLSIGITDVRSSIQDLAVVTGARLKRHVSKPYRPTLLLKH